MTDLILPAYRNTTLKETDVNDSGSILNLTNLGKPQSEDIPEPGSEENPWIGFNRLVNGTRQFHALSGKERRQYRRAIARGEEADQRRGQRAYNRDQRRNAFDAGTVRMQAKILGGEVEVTTAMRANLEGHIIREHRVNELKLTESDRKDMAAARREARLFDRRHARVDAGKGRHADLVALGLR